MTLLGWNDEYLPGMKDLDFEHRDLFEFCRVNTLHDQAIEHEKPGFVLGVQCHPEYLIGDKTQRLLFNALVNTCKVRDCRHKP